jgi:NDP-sugar pyrophosphorylase family protein
MAEVRGEYSSIILCGGAGTRLAALTGGLPKPLFGVGAEVFLKQKAG